jgi:aldehyde dehydrogenase (NAD+)
VTATATLAQYQMYIGGHWVDASSRDHFESDDPFEASPWALIPRGTAADVDLAVDAARRAFTTGEWPTLTASRRGLLLRRLGDLVGEHAGALAAIEVRDNGKLYAEMSMHTAYMAQWYHYYGGLADKVEGAVLPTDKPDTFNYTRYEPLGVVAAIIPWNSPLLLLAWKLAPALAAGNTVVVKPSEVTPAGVIEVARLAETAGLPEGVVNVVTGLGATGKHLVEHAKVAKISFTGGIESGRKVAAAAGARLAHCTLELGGKSPNIVFDDARLEAAEAGIFAGIFAAGGQTCVAGSRAYIHATIFEDVVGRLVERARKIVLGDPMAPETQMGPIATSAQRAKNESMVGRALEQGARLLCGGRRPAIRQFPDGFFFEPTILSNVAHDSELCQNEVFGPVLAVIPFHDEDEVIARANDTAYGLAAGVWTKDLSRAHRMARALAAGTVWVNMYRAMAFNSPFGDYKQSGIGRHNGLEAIDQYLQTKSVWCELSDEVQDPFVLRT